MTETVLSFHDLLDLARLRDGWKVEYRPGPEIPNRRTTTRPEYEVGCWQVYYNHFDGEHGFRLLKECPRDARELLCLLQGKSRYDF